MANSKIFTIFAGVNGAGKSTLFVTDNSDNLGVRLNTDEIVRKSGKDWRDVQAQIDAGKRLLALQQDCFDKGLSCNRETTLCGNNILKSVVQAKELGYSVHLRYVGVSSAEIAKERVKKRINLGGHGVSENTIEHRYGTSIENFLKIYKYCDKINIYDNSGDALVLVAYSLNGVIVKTKTDIEWVNELISKIKES